MASALDLTAYDAALKEHYTDDRVVDMIYKNNPTLALLPKYKNFGGKKLPLTIIYGNPQGRSKTFSNAKTRSTASSSLIEAFELTRAKDYGIATIDNETLLASKGNANAFMEAATCEIDGIINSVTRSCAIGVFRGVDASIGQVLAEPSTNTGNFVLTMKNAADIANIEVGQMIVLYAATSGGSALHSDGTDDEWEVEAVDRSAGTFTLTGDYTASGNIAADAYIFVEGDRGLGIAGFEAWAPASAPGATAFFGVNRSVDVSRLGGQRLDATALPIEEALIEADAQVNREGFGLTHFIMNNKKFGDLKKALGSKVQYVDVSVTPRISFRGIMVDGERGPIQVFGDHNCQGDRIWGLNMEYVKLYSLGEPVRVIDTDGLQMLRQSDDDGVEVRYGFYGNVGCKAPGSMINIQV